MLGSDYPEFISACTSKEGKSVWLNPLMGEPQSTKKSLEESGFRLERLPYSEFAFSIVEGPDRPGLEEDFKQGLFNIQEKAAMLPAIVLDPKPGDRVLDGFAAPGNKTLQIACLVNNGAEIIALEREPARLNVLDFNIRKFGMNVSAKKIDFQKFKDRAGFNRILIDAPCSSEGLVRKSMDGLKEWSQKKVLNMSKRQKKAIVKGFDLLAPKGTMVYSTCSLSPEEDEEVIEHLITERPETKVEKIEIAGVNASAGLSSYDGTGYDSSIRNCVRLYPHKWDCQPFFMAKISKE